MAQTILDNGGVVCADLTKNNCTHLIALSADTDKYKAAERWGPDVVKVVRREWLADCLARGGADRTDPSPLRLRTTFLLQWPLSLAFLSPFFRYSFASSLPSCAP